MTPPLAPAPADCPALSESEAAPLIAAAATARQLQPRLLKAVIQVESGFHPCAVSPKGAMGLMQIMPETADAFKLANPFDPAGNIDAGSRYLKELLGRYQGDLKRALAAYNAGPGRVDGKESPVPPIPETEDYVARILQLLQAAAPVKSTP